MRRAMMQLWHAFFGHPRDQVYWGTYDEGAVCKCGTRWWHADMIP